MHAKVYIYGLSSIICMCSAQTCTCICIHIQIHSERKRVFASVYTQGLEVHYNLNEGVN